MLCRGVPQAAAGATLASGIVGTVKEVIVRTDVGVVLVATMVESSLIRSCT